MAQGDWNTGAKLVPLIVNITYDESGSVNHVGLGYQIVLASGRVATEKGWTWIPNEEDSLVLQDLMTKLLSAAKSYEGIEDI